MGPRCKPADYGLGKSRCMQRQVEANNEQTEKAEGELGLI